MIRSFFANGLSAYNFLMLCGYLFATLFALVLHELGHALVAKWNGDMTAKNMGRLTLNPVKHLDPIGTLLMLFVGFGWAKPVPVNTNNFAKQRRGIFTVSIGGVSMNLLQILVYIPMLLLTCYLGTLTGGGLDNEMTFARIFFLLFYGFFFWGIIVNATLIAFNLLPISPLDGFHVVETFTSYTNKFVVFMRRYGHFILLGLLILGVVANFLSQFWRGFVYFDIIGLYISAVSDGMLMLIGSVFNLAGIL